MPPQSVTLSDIAFRAGVTKTTVSRALGQKFSGEVSPQVRERIQAIARDLNYKPNIAAKGLQRRRSFLVGVLHAEGNIRLVPGISRGMQRVLEENDFAPIVYLHDRTDEELRLLEQCLKRGVEGIIVNISNDFGKTNAARFVQLRDTGFPIVEINGRFIDGVPHVTADYQTAGRMLTSQLVESGRRRIALYISDLYRQNEVRPGLGWTINAFWRGYEAAMLDAGLKSEVVTFSMREQAFGKVESRGLMELAATSAEIPSAVVCSGPTTADRVSRFIAGTPQAHDIRLAVFGDLQSLGFLNPNSVLLGFPGVAIGETAARLLVKQLEAPSAEDIAIPPELPPGG